MKATRIRLASARSPQLLAALSILLLVGCNQSSSQPDKAAAGHENSAASSKNSAADSAAHGDPPIVASDLPGGAPKHPVATTKLKPRELVDGMIKAYHEAKTYADAAEVRLRLERTNQPSSNIKPVPQSVTFVRPNKVRVECFDSVIVCDGKKIHASAAAIPQQVLELDAPEKLRLEDLLSSDAVRESFQNAPAGFPLQLTMLFPETQVQPILETEPKLLGGDSFDGHDCQRLQFDTPDGPLVLWIDPDGFVLRLMELPVGELRRRLETEGPVKDLALSVAFLGARLNEKVPEVAFQFEVPSAAKRVKRLIGPPPSPPSELLGRAVPDFSFTALGGKAVNRAALSGKVVVLDFWFTGCAPCQQVFPMLDQVYQKYKDNDRVVFVGVSIDPAEVDDARLREVLKQWGGDFPIARDTARQAESVFKIPGAPTMMVLGPDGTLQDEEIGLNPKLATDLPNVIETLLAGKSTAADAKARAEQLSADYERAIQEAPARAENLVESMPVAKIAPRDEPRRVKLSRRWMSSDIKNASNILVVEDSKDPKATKILVLEGAHSVVELDTAGQTVGRHELAIPQQAIINFLRTAVDSAGKRYYVGSASSQQQLFLFDEKWAPLVRFPSEEQGKHAGIGDVQFVDFDGKQDPVICVGYWGLVGVQGVSLAGKRIWNDRSMQFVLRLAPGARDEQGRRRLLCSNSRGSIVPIDATGSPQPEWLLQGLMLEIIGSSDSINDKGAATTDICAIASNLKRDRLLVGLGPRGEDLWHYPLPNSIPQTPIEPITSAQLVGPKRHWIVAAPDSSIHFVGGDGTPLDAFHYGQMMTGIAGARIGDEALLIVATQRGVEALKVEAK